MRKFVIISLIAATGSFGFSGFVGAQGTSQNAYDVDQQYDPPITTQNWEAQAKARAAALGDLSQCRALVNDLEGIVDGLLKDNGKLRTTIGNLSATNLQLRSTVQQVTNTPTQTTAPAEESRALSNQSITYTNVAQTGYVAGETVAADAAARTAAATTYTVDATALAARLLEEQRLAAELSRIATQQKVDEAIRILGMAIDVANDTLGQVYTRLSQLYSAINNTVEQYVSRTKPTPAATELIGLQGDVQTLTRQMYLMLYNIRSGKTLADFRGEVEKILASNPTDPKAAVTAAMRKAVDGLEAEVERMSAGTEQYVDEYGSLGPQVINGQ